MPSNVEEILKGISKEFTEDVLELKIEGIKMPHIVVKQEKIGDILKWVKEKGYNHLSTITAVDDPPENIWLIYHLVNIETPGSISIKVKLPRENPEVRTVSDIFPTALWHEREAYDLMGVRFLEHPDLRRILMPEDWVGHPLRKDYQQVEEYHGISTK